ncbi:hypothetical protein [Nonomuraea roseoviolacea]|uniref:RDD family protein n=1 Tax=Nonomuraea roseoviolacea subsp. carminata TaxID=160689 RepID=A0ABT1K0B0_9ACTN|nr:hypothetical protein [Nonomuraea roseoviolacea]MCP2346459.1 hypothetical protein [Nonomuraea roseoviolacea subsp. carminata]
MAESAFSSSDTARHRRTILWADTASLFLLAATGMLLLVSRRTMTDGLLPALAALFAQACAVGAAVVLVAGLLRRPGAPLSMGGLSLIDRESLGQWAAGRVLLAVLWKLMALRVAVSVIVLQAALLGVSTALSW